MNESKFKKIYLISIWTITFLVVIFCSIRYLAFRNDANSANAMISDRKTFGNETIRSLEIDSENSDINIVRGDSLYVDYSVPKSDYLKVEMKDGILSITQGKGIDFCIFKNAVGKGKITVSIPNEAELINADLTVDMGDIAISDMKLKQLDLDADMGNVEMNKCYVADGEIDTDMGNVDVDIDFESLSITSDMGDVDITTKSDLSKSTLEIDNDMGTCKVNGIEWKVE